MGIKNPQELPRKEYWQAYADFLYLRSLDREYYQSILEEVLLPVLLSKS